MRHFLCAIRVKIQIQIIEQDAIDDAEVIPSVGDAAPREVATARKPKRRKISVDTPVVSIDESSIVDEQ